MSTPSHPRVLVVGAGYAGTRFLRALTYLSTLRPIDVVGICDASSDRLQTADVAYPTYTDVRRALWDTRPNTVVIAVSEDQHAVVLDAVDCAPWVRVALSEKPLVPNTGQLQEFLDRKRPDLAIAVNMVERHSAIVSHYRDFASERGLRPRHVEFFWGKSRVFDPRPTIGVTSEAIHALDLVDVLFGFDDLRVERAIGLRSDFTADDCSVLASLDLTARAESYSVAGHTSFIWPRRQRVVTALLTDEDGRLYRATLDFDVPHWDDDRLDVVAFDDHGRWHRVLDSSVASASFPAALRGVGKLSDFLARGLDVLTGDARDLCDASQALKLQRLLDGLEQEVHAVRAGRLHADRVAVG